MPKQASGTTTNTNPLFKKFLDYVSQDETRKRVQDTIIDPLLNHVMKRVFPYIILTCVLFILLLLVVLLTLGIIVFQMRKNSVLPGVE
jgi:uncharacterized membrane protein YdfJ with MMPL/SSD domain